MRIGIDVGGTNTDAMLLGHPRQRRRQDRDHS
jgi:N-methylhydantoinase A/oxoprolinase/acetone carboxylase beta subunit